MNLPTKRRNNKKIAKKRNNRNKSNKDDETRKYGQQAMKLLHGNQRQPITLNATRSLIVPDRIIVSLMFLDVTHGAINSVGNNMASYRYRPTSAYDIDPILGGTSMPGFIEWTTFYNNYRVLGYAVEIMIENQEAFAVTAYTITLNTDPGAAPSLASVKGFLMQPYLINKDLSPKGGMDKCIIRKNIDCRSFVGSLINRFDDSYAAQYNASPTNNIYQQIGIYSQPNVFVNGVWFKVRFCLEVEFYERLPINS